MSVLPLRLGHSFESYISGEVIIHPSAVLAPGVILQAAPNSKIIIGSGVCVGMGSILQVHEGTLEIEAGANLGAGLLIVGKGKIGANACIGAATTIFNCSVEPGQVIAAGSVLGDTSRQISQSPQLTSETKQSEPSTFESPQLTSETKQSEPSTNEPVTSIKSDNGTGRQPEQKEEESISPSSPSSPTQESQVGSYIYGQQSIQKLLVTLFPHKQSLNKPTSDGQSE